MMKDINDKRDYIKWLIDYAGHTDISTRHKKQKKFRIKIVKQILKTNKFDNGLCILELLVVTLECPPQDIYCESLK